MLVEAATAILLVFYRPEGVSFVAAFAGLARRPYLALHRPPASLARHRALGHGFDERTVSGLVLYMWIRTIAWSARGLLVLWMTARIVG